MGDVDRKLIVAEVFGPTIQGEGPSAGQRAGFVRTGRCNLDCSWCDTPYTWDWHGKNGTVYDPAVEIDAWDLATVVGKIEAMHVPICVITGGEPLLHPAALEELIPALLECVERIEIETNGTRPPLAPLRADELAYNVSPKLATSGVDRERAWVPSAIAALRDRPSIFKFVIADTDEDVAEVIEFTETFEIDDDRIWLMPEGTTSFPHAGAVADAAIEHGWQFTHRLHALAWGATRGR